MVSAHTYPGGSVARLTYPKRMQVPTSNTPGGSGFPPFEPDQSEPTGLPEHYVLEAEIGRGGMGTVYRARDVKHGRLVAVKVLRSEIAQTYGRDRFLREIRTAAGLLHPHIVSVFDSGEADGTLYYVMPYIEGESLRQRLSRENRLDAAAAIRIASDVAAALEHAHGRGYAHRDVKPENILLSANGHVWLVDFGVARVLETATARLTASGMIMGSPLYASPEQIAGEPSIDHRTDIYSLGCVLYEMLSGSPPFLGETVQSVLYRHLTEPVQPLRATLPDIPVSLDSVVLRALAKKPGDRFDHAAEFRSALRGVSPVTGAIAIPRGIRLTRRTSWMLAAAVIMGVGLLTVAALADLRWPFTGAGREPAPLDSTRFVVVPISVAEDLRQLDADARLGDALASWVGIEVLDPDLHGVAAATLATPDSVAGVMRRLNAGRFIGGSLTRKGDSLRVHVELRDGARPDVRLNQYRHTYLLDPARIDLYFREAVDSLLLRGIAHECVDGGTGTRVLAAVRACDAAFSALQDGDLVGVAAFFGEALRHDREYSRAALWLVLSQSWLKEAPPEAVRFIGIALDDSSRLSNRELDLARAQRLVLGGQFYHAQQIYEQIIARDSSDFAAWLGLGDSYRRDNRVVPAPRSRSGWAFASSYHRAVQAYRTAFEIRPELLGGYRDRSFKTIRDALLVSTSSIRVGHAASPDTTSFVAYPSWDTDSLLLVPLTLQQVTSVSSGSWPRSVALAADRQRDLFQHLATRWARSYPNSSDAHEALAVAAELKSGGAAIELIRRARALASTSEDQFRLGTSEAWLLVKFGLPDNAAYLSRARRLADSLVSSATAPTREQARALSSLSILLGRPNDAARYARVTALATSTGQAAGELLASSRALLAFAAAGAPLDSIVALEKQVEGALRNMVSPDSQQAYRTQLLTQAVMLSFPAKAMAALSSVAETGLYTKAEWAYQRGDTSTVIALLQQLALEQAHARPADLTIDGVFVSAWLEYRLGLLDAAAARLESSLGAVRWSLPGRLENIASIGTLLRAMALRANIAAELGDRTTASKWASALLELWSDAAAELQPDVKKLRDIVRDN